MYDAHDISGCGNIGTRIWKYRYPDVKVQVPEQGFFQDFLVKAGNFGKKIFWKPPQNRWKKKKIIKKGPKILWKKTQIQQKNV